LGLQPECFGDSGRLVPSDILRVPSKEEWSADLETQGAGEKRRSARIKLSVPVIVATETLERQPVQEVTHTITVNAHGGLFKLRMELLAGQPITLTNMKTNVKQRCRVARVEHLPGPEFGVAFEFENAAPEFWSADFPPADWNVVASET
jgi:hypothetical protein